MMHRCVLSTAAALSGLAAMVLVPPTPTAAREVALWFVRPAVLPFAWEAMAEASRQGDSEECFARGQQILDLLPTWTDGHQAFACDYALRSDRIFGNDEQRLADAERRLQVAMAWLDAARPTAGRHELDLLQSLAMLPEIAARQTPGLGARLSQHGAAAVTDAWLAVAERKFPTAAVREQRTFFAPRLAAGMLASGNRDGAISALETAIERSADVRNRALATEWRDRLIEVVRNLRGEAVDLVAVRADSRLAILLPYLR